MAMLPQLEKGFGIALAIYLSVLFLCALLLPGCGEMARVSNQSYHCMTEGGSDYCRPQPTPVPGTPGRDGTDGSNGEAGPQGDRGPAGSPGQAGADGDKGTDGYSTVSSTAQLEDGDALCTSGGFIFRIARDLNRNGELDGGDDRQQLAYICHGEEAPAAPLLPVAIVDPCGDKPGVHDEVFIRFQNGTLIASFSDNTKGKNTRFSILVPGSYITTDGSLCYFSVDSVGALYNEHY